VNVGGVSAAVTVSTAGQAGGGGALDMKTLLALVAALVMAAMKRRRPRSSRRAGERDVTREHPRAVHAALGTRSEIELQQYLDDCKVADYYGDDGQHVGPDDSGLELRWAS
jgi:hypothetical protein